jgi:NAD(P)-dependent dehydrogenase (short-subunit alcohol dehydrogenase family)
MGSAIVHRFLDDGHSVFASDISGRRLGELEESVAAQEYAGRYAGHLKADATKRESCAGIAAAARDAMGAVDVLVNVVGGYRGELYEHILSITDERFDSAVDMTLRSPLLMTQMCAPEMIERGWGRIVNVSSIAKNGAEGQADYAALKAGVVGLTRTAAMELAPAINVNAVVPGVIDTMVMERMSDEMKRRYRERIPLDRWGQPSEVAAAVAFLASADASYITGEDLYVAGGFRSWL